MEDVLFKPGDFTKTPLKSNMKASTGGLPFLDAIKNGTPKLRKTPSRKKIVEEKIQICGERKSKSVERGNPILGLNKSSASCRNHSTDRHLLLLRSIPPQSGFVPLSTVFAFARTSIPDLSDVVNNICFSLIWR